MPYGVTQKYGKKAKKSCFLVLKGYLAYPIGHVLQEITIAALPFQG